MMLGNIIGIEENVVLIKINIDLNKYDSLVKEIIKSIKKDCSFDKKYEKKVDKYFEYLDCSNCKSIYDEIVK